MRILVDQDEVLCGWTKAVVKAWNAAHPEKLAPPVTRWDTNGFLDHPEARYFPRSLMLKPEFWLGLEAIKGAREGMLALFEMGHEVRIATQVLPEVGGPAYEGKLQWVRKHLPWFDITHVYALKHKNELYADLLLDDAPHQLEAFERSGRSAVALDYAWNQDVKTHHRVKNWPEFIQLVQTLSETRIR